MTIRGLNAWLAAFYRRHHRDLVRYAARLVGDRDGGEDVVQTAYLKVAGRRAQAAAIARPRAYLFTATRSAAYDFAARRNAEWLHRVEVEELEALPGGSDPGEALERRQRILRLAVLLNALPAACQTAFLMNKVEGYSHREIAAHLGVSVSMVEKHIMRALLHCRDSLREDEAADDSR